MFPVIPLDFIVINIVANKYNKSSKKIYYYQNEIKPVEADFLDFVLKLPKSDFKIGNHFFWRPSKNDSLVRNDEMPNYFLLSCKEKRKKWFNVVKQTLFKPGDKCNSIRYSYWSEGENRLSKDPGLLYFDLIAWYADNSSKCFDVLFKMIWDKNKSIHYAIIKKNDRSVIESPELMYNDSFDIKL